MTEGRDTETHVASTASAGAGSDDEADEISFLEMASVLLKRWRLVIGLPLAAALLVAVIVLILPAKFTATATFVPETESEGFDLPSGLAGLAEQFGMALPVSGGTNSPAFYADLLESRTLLDAVLVTSFADPRGDAVSDSAILLDILGIDGDSQAERLEEGREELEDATSIKVDNETNVVSVSVETRHPALSAAVANLYIDLVNRFNLETRQSNARERRRFNEGQVATAERELRAAEEELKLFLERNRQFQGSPELTFQYERLQRQVTIEQEVFTTLRRSYEEARIQEVNDTPVITVIDSAVPPVEKSSPRRTLSVVLAFLVGGVLGIFGAFGREFVERARVSDREEYVEFTSRWAEFKAELKSMVTRRSRRDS